MTETTVADQPCEVDKNGLTCPHCKHAYSAPRTNALTKHDTATGVLQCERCNGSFEWIRATRIFYSTRAILEMH